jgi:glycosyltransferase involved in cell wall biosynthesis
VPSEAVRQALLPYFAQAQRPDVPVWTIPHGVHLRALPQAVLASPPPVAADPHPYFVCLGTIEARKNHLLLLTLWRRLVEERGADAPHLVLIGKRGWENEQVIDMLERCPSLQGVVHEHNALPDEEVVRFLKGARALLFPSFAEGYGLPLSEALSLGVPAICSDIAVFREIGGGIPVLLDPLDGIAWLETIRAFIDDDPARTRQCGLMHAWSLPGWVDSVRLAMEQTNRIGESAGMFF